MKNKRVRQKTVTTKTKQHKPRYGHIRTPNGNVQIAERIRTGTFRNDEDDETFVSLRINDAPSFALLPEAAVALVEQLSAALDDLANEEDGACGVCGGPMIVDMPPDPESN